MLYLGYVGFTIPFAFAVGALISRRTGADWIRSTRRFALVAWTFLGFGILLGALWSYAELGWGGYWAWDPVENASLMPWLTGTAFIHSIMVQEKRGMLRCWNVVADHHHVRARADSARSWCAPGILDSIHAFGASTLGTPFLVFIGIVVVGSVALIVAAARPALGGAARLAALARGVLPAQQPGARGALRRRLLGHLLPADLRGADRRPSRASGRRGFNASPPRSRSSLVLLAGIGPVIAWRRTTAPRCGARSAAPARGRGGAGGAAAARPGRRQPRGRRGARDVLLRRLRARGRRRRSSGAVRGPGGS